MPAVIVFAALQFLGLLQCVDRGLKRKTVVLIVAAVGNVDVGIAASTLADVSTSREKWPWLHRRASVNLVARNSVTNHE